MLKGLTSKGRPQFGRLPGDKLQDLAGDLRGVI
jgi:hypothetical protein